MTVQQQISDTVKVVVPFEVAIGAFAWIFLLKYEPKMEAELAIAKNKHGACMKWKHKLPRLDLSPDWPEKLSVSDESYPYWASYMALAESMYERLQAFATRHQIAGV
jgi:hypothetical protein